MFNKYFELKKKYLKQKGGTSIYEKKGERVILEEGNERENEKVTLEDVLPLTTPSKTIEENILNEAHIDFFEFNKHVMGPYSDCELNRKYVIDVLQNKGDAIEGIHLIVDYSNFIGGVMAYELYNDYKDINYAIFNIYCLLVEYTGDFNINFNFIYGEKTTQNIRQVIEILKNAGYIDIREYTFLLNELNSDNIFRLYKSLDHFNSIINNFRQFIINCRVAKVSICLSFMANQDQVYENFKKILKFYQGLNEDRTNLLCDLFVFKFSQESHDYIASEYVKYGIKQNESDDILCLSLYTYYFELYSKYINNYIFPIVYSDDMYRSFYKIGEITNEISMADSLDFISNFSNLNLICKWVQKDKFGDNKISCIILNNKLLSPIFQFSPRSNYFFIKFCDYNGDNDHNLGSNKILSNFNTEMVVRTELKFFRTNNKNEPFKQYLYVGFNYDNIDYNNIIKYIKTIIPYLIYNFRLVDKVMSNQ